MAKFFSVIGKFDEIELKEFLIRRYGTLKIIYEMELADLSAFIMQAYKIYEEENLRAEWVSLLPYMVSGQLKYMSLEQYIDRRTGRNVDMRPAEEIIAEINELHSKKGGT